MFTDYYEVLEISSSASLEQVKASFKKQALKWHPDINPSVDTNRKMQEINEAYLILKDPESKRLYDVEYLKFQAYKQAKKDSSESSNTSETFFTDRDYKVEDETLFAWMRNAKVQAVELAKQTIEDMRILTKVGIKAGGKTIAQQIVAYVIVGIIIAFGIKLFKGCNKVPENQKVIQTYYYSSAEYIGLKDKGGSNYNRATGLVQFKKDTIILEAAYEDGNISKDIGIVENVKYGKDSSELQYQTNVGYFNVTIKEKVITHVLLGTNDYIIFFTKKIK